MPDALPPAPPLSIVMPVYNEAASIGIVIAEWREELARLRVDYELLVFDDGSTDGTEAVLRELEQRHATLRVMRHPNAGHGPTILQGYRRATGEWVLQIDSDGEIPASAFEALWRRRGDFDVLIGRRTDRSAPLVRRLVTAASRLIVRMLFGGHVHDVNAPFRLMRRAVLRELAGALPDDLFAPNVVLTGLAVRRGLRVGECAVPHIGRRHGEGSLGRLKVLRAAVRAFAQTVVVAWRDRRYRRGV